MANSIIGSALVDFYNKLVNRGAAIVRPRTRTSTKSDEHFLKLSDFQLYTTLLSGLMPDPDEVLLKAGLTPSAYYQLMTDSHVAGSVMQRKSRVKRMNLVIQPSDANDSKAVAAAELVQQQFDKIERIPEIISEILDAPLYGATYLELFWNRLPISTDKPNGEIVLLNAMAKPFEWFVWDEYGNLKAKDFDAATAYLVRDLPVNKFIAAVNEGSYRNPYGERAFKRAFWPFMFKKGGLRFWTEFIEKYGMPYLHGKLDSKASDDDLATLHNDLVAMVRNSIVVSRSDSSAAEINVVEAGGKGASSDAYKAYKNAMNIEISKAILGETLTIENSETGSQAATDTHLTVLESIQDDDRRLVERTLKKIARLIVTLNLGEQTPEPKISLIDPKEISDKVAARDAILAEKLGVKFSKQYISETYRIQEDRFEIVVPQVMPLDNNASGEDKDEDEVKGAAKGTNASKAAETASGDNQEKKPNFEEQNFSESFTIQDGLDKYIDGVVGRLNFLSKPLQDEISTILKTSKDYDECLSRIATLSTAMDSQQFTRVFTDALDVAYYLGEMASKKGAI